MIVAIDSDGNVLDPSAVSADAVHAVLVATSNGTVVTFPHRGLVCRPGFAPRSRRVTVDHLREVFERRATERAEDE